MGLLNRRLIMAMTATVGLTAYAVDDRDFCHQVDSIPDEWTYSPQFSQSVPTDDNWWKSFDDVMLNSLISAGVDNNFDLIAASRRMEIARNAIRSTKAGYLPTVAMNASWAKNRESSLVMSSKGRPVSDSYFSLGLSANWEIDVFGRIWSQSKSADALYKASRAEYAAVMVSMAANIAKTYMQLRVWQAQLELSRQHAVNQQHIVDLTIARKDAGLASMLDVTQARVVLYSTQSSVPVLENSISTGINAIAVLTGVYPDKIRESLLRGSPLPDYRQLVSVGIPMELLRRRPDVVEAEMRLASDAALIGVSKKDFLPTLSLSGSIGTSAHDAGDLFTDDSFTYSIVPTLSWTLFDGMRRKYNLADARARMEVSVANYNQTVMTAVQETENAMSGYLAALKHIDMLSKVVEQSDKSLSLSVDLYKQGLTPFSNVVDAQMNLLEYQNSLISAKGDALTSLVDLYEALGGGWNESEL